MAGSYSVCICVCVQTCSCGRWRRGRDGGEGEKREPVNAEVRVVCKGKSSEETCIMEEAMS